MNKKGINYLLLLTLPVEHMSKKQKQKQTNITITRSN